MTGIPVVAECIGCGQFTANALQAGFWEPVEYGTKFDGQYERICKKCWVDGFNGEGWARCECCGDAKPFPDLEPRANNGNLGLQYYCEDCALECKYWHPAEDCRILERRDHYSAKQQWFIDIQEQEAAAERAAQEALRVTDEELSEVMAMIAESARRVHQSKRPSEL